MKTISEWRDTLRMLPTLAAAEIILAEVGNHKRQRTALRQGRRQSKGQVHGLGARRLGATNASRNGRSRSG